MNAVTPFAQDATASAPFLTPLPGVDPSSFPIRQSPMPGLSAQAEIATQGGPKAATSLRPGDRLATRDGGTVSVVAVHLHRVTPEDLLHSSRNAPIRIEPGALPGVDLLGAQLLAPDQHVLLDDPSLPTGPCLVPARALCTGGAIRRVLPEDGVIYVELTVEAPHLINAGGLWVEVGDVQDAPRHGTRPAQVCLDDTRVFTPL